MARKHHSGEDAIPRTQIEKSAHRLAAVRHGLEHDGEVLLSKRNCAAHGIEKPADGFFPLPCGKRRVIFSDHQILHA